MRMKAMRGCVTAAVVAMIAAPQPLLACAACYGKSDSDLAKKALARKIGARGLRSIMEQSLIDTMFELPTLDGVAKVVLDEHTIQDEAKPLLVYREPAKFSA